jgi:hypothetical protein
LTVILIITKDITMKNLLVFIISAFVVLSGCDTTVKTGDSGRILPNITGGAGEVLVVVDKYIWDGETGELLKDLLKEEFPGLPQSEPMFDVTQITSSSFDNMFRFHRSVVLVTIKETIEEPSVRYRKNVWARPQILVQLEAPNLNQLQQLIRDNMEQIQGFLVQYDRQRITDSYADSKDLEIQKMMAENHQIRLAIPRGYNVDLSTDNYSSVSIESSEFSQVLHVYEYPASGKEELQSGRILENRNAFVKKYVKGPGDDSYMTTSMVYPPIFYDIKKNGKELVETRGLWELENGFMGGPFVSHSVYDEQRQRIVTVEGYVYYPNQKKRIKIRQLEAIIYSLEII